MANSFVRYTGNGSTTAYSISYSYRAAADLIVTINGAATTSYTLNGAGSTLTFDTAPANASAIEIRRKTSQTSRLTDYAAGSVLTENDLDTDSEQAFFMSQEAIDDAQDVISLDNADFQYDVGNKRLKNVADPTSAQDAVTKNYLENTWLSTANKTTLTTVNSNIANINAVNSNSTNINLVAGDATDIGIVATNIADVSKVADDITKVIAVANDLAEAVSEVETVADDLNEATSEIEVVAGAIVNVDLVGGSIASVNTLAGLNTEIGNLNTIRADITAVNTNSANITAVNNNSTNINTIAGLNTELGLLGTSAIVTDMDLLGTSANVTAMGLLGTSANVTAQGLLGTSANVTAMSTVATNIAGVNSFADRYRVASTDPSTSLDEGDLVYNSTGNVVKYYNGSAWVALTTDTDVKTLVSANDTTAGYLNGKLVAGTGISFTENSDGGNETLTITNTGEDPTALAIALG